MLKIVKNLLKSLKMLTMLILWINCFECLFTCPGKRFPLTEKLYLYNIACYTLKKKKHKYSVFKNTKKSDKINLTLFNTVESNIMPE